MECRNTKNTTVVKKSKHTLLNKLATSKTDRRTIQGSGTPQENETRYQNRIEYNTEENKLVCKTCNKNMNRKTNKMPYNMHAIISKQRKYGKKTKMEAKKMKQRQIISNSKTNNLEH